jgi:hypothetical protein
MQTPQGAVAPRGKFALGHGEESAHLGGSQYPSLPINLGLSANVSAAADKRVPSDNRHARNRRFIDDPRELENLRLTADDRERTGIRGMGDACCSLNPATAVFVLAPLVDAQPSSRLDASREFLEIQPSLLKAKNL